MMSFFRILFMIVCVCVPMLACAQEAIQIMSGRNTFDSFEQYADFRDPRPFKVPLVKAQAILMPRFVTHLGIGDMVCSKVLREPPYIPEENVAGITPSMAQIMRDLHRPQLPARPVHSREGLIVALQQAAQGKTGPLLVAGDRYKLKVMELRGLTNP